MKWCTGFKNDFDTYTYIPCYPGRSGNCGIRLIFMYYVAESKSESSGKINTFLGKNGTVKFQTHVRTLIK